MPTNKKYSRRQRAGDRALIQQLLGGDKQLVAALLAPKPSVTPDPAIQRTLEHLSQRVRRLPPPDLADTLERLPGDARRALWQMVPDETRGHVLSEVSQAVWDDVISGMSDRDLLRALEHLEIDEQIYLAQNLPRDLLGRLAANLPPSERERVRQVLHYPKGSVGALMEFGVIIIRPAMTLGAVHRYLRRLGKLPENTDKLFITGRDNRLVGTLETNALLINAPKKRVDEVMDSAPVTFSPQEDDEAAARVFERDNLVSAAVVDDNNRLLGRLTIDEIVNLVYEETDNDLRGMGGIGGDGDIFAPIGKAVKARWMWLAINLCTAFIASRVIDGFEDTIGKLVALAALMPIVAGIGGNTGNQTITMIVRAMALQDIQPSQFRFLIVRELGVALINGAIWGGLMGLVTWGLYHDPALGGLMSLAMMLNLLLAALMGVVIPLVMVKLGRDPAVGSSVMITAITDTGGFFIFLGLATLLLT